MTVKLPVSGTPVHIDFDPAEVRRRIDSERERRLTREKLSQFQGLSDVREVDDSDPYTQPIERDAVSEELQVVILGAGFGGLCAGVRLKLLGVTNFRIVEEGGDFGGTWYWNRYPGVQCDLESYVYMPLLDETGYVPSQRYADGDEILEYARRVGREYDLYGRALFQTKATSVVWHEERRLWEVRTDRGDVLQARFLVRANGPLSKPQIPRIPGINEFAGKMFHTSRWDYDYTGGNSHGGLEGLRDRRVAIIGTGATAIQAIPYVAEYAKELFVVQRTPIAVGPRGNRPTDPLWAASLKKGWQAARNENYNLLINRHDPDQDLVDDYFTHLFGALRGRHLVDCDTKALPAEDQVRLAELADMNELLKVHRLIDELVDDRDTAEALKPWYGVTCKRPSSNDEYYAAFNRRSVHLVSAPRGVDGLTKRGVVVDGREYEVDLIIFATGFETGSSAASRYGYDVIGRDGERMSEYFAKGARTLHGFCTHGFPNFFELGLSQNAFVVNFGFMLDRKAVHIARIIGYALAHNVATIEAELGAQEAWGQLVATARQAYLAYLTTCTPGYYNGQGDVAHAFLYDAYRGSEVDYWNMIENWWAAGSLEGLSVRPMTVSAVTAGRANG
jgi:cyclohexanone monooxygenase